MLSGLREDRGCRGYDKNILYSYEKFSKNKKKLYVTCLIFFKRLTILRQENTATKGHGK